MKSTVAASKVCESTCRTPKSSFAHGLACEDLVKSYYQKQGYTLLSQRWKTPFAEIDLVLEKKERGETLLLEVKSLSRNHWASVRVTPYQKKRLKRAYYWALKRFHGDVLFHLVFVRRDGQIEVIQQFLS